MHSQFSLTISKVGLRPAVYDMYMPFVSLPLPESWHLASGFLNECGVMHHFPLSPPLFVLPYVFNLEKDKTAFCV